MSGSLRTSRNWISGVPPRVPDLLGLLAALFLGLQGGCGAKTVDLDAGVDAATDARVDANQDDAGDAGVGGADAAVDGGGRSFVECDPYVPLACQTGEKCQVVLAPLPDAGVDLYFACVPLTTGSVGPRLPCSSAVPLHGTSSPDAVTHSCAGGAVCVVDGFALCRPICGREGLTCRRSDELCVFVTQSPAVAACLEASKCDPVAQSGCGTEEGCYARSNQFGDWIGDCAPVRPPEGEDEPLAEGSACSFFDNCEAGTGCLQRVSALGEFEGNAACRRYCAAGVSPDPCSGPQLCRQLPLSGSGMFLTPQPIGACI